MIEGRKKWEKNNSIIYTDNLACRCYIPPEHTLSCSKASVYPKQQKKKCGFYSLTDAAASSYLFVCVNRIIDWAVVYLTANGGKRSCRDIKWL